MLRGKGILRIALRSDKESANAKRPSWQSGADGIRLLQGGPGSTQGQDVCRLCARRGGKAIRKLKTESLSRHPKRFDGGCPGWAKPSSRRSLQNAWRRSPAKQLRQTGGEAVLASYLKQSFQLC